MVYQYQLSSKVEQPETNLRIVSPLRTRSPKDGQSLYSQALATYTKTYQRTGSLFTKYIKRIPIASGRYLIHLVSYIHRNPQKHGLVADYRRYRYSSDVAVRYQRRSQMLVRDVLAWFGSVDAFKGYHLQFDEDLMLRRATRYSYKFRYRNAISCGKKQLLRNISEDLIRHLLMEVD